MKKKNKERMKIALPWILWGAAATIAGLLVLVFGALAYLGHDLPSVEQILHYQITQSTKIYDRTGQVLLYEIGNGQRRTVVPFSGIPQSLKDATIAIEDGNFYHEPAFDWRGILRSVWVDVRYGGFLQGGSTITQQLARNAFLTPEQTVTRKIKELMLAVELNRHYSKDEILNLYLNEIPYGPTAYGVEAASETYFGKPVARLTLAESAVLAALPKAPTYYNPWGSHRKELLARSRLVLQKMLELGMVTKEEEAAALKNPPTFTAQDQGIKAPHFVMAVVDYLTQKYGEDTVREGGLKVTTTLDWNMQQIAEKAVAAGVARTAALYQGTNSSLVAQDARTGQILALVGSADYFDTAHDGNFDVALQGLRQPGSSLKPFVYLTAFEKGYTPDTVLFDTPTEFTVTNPACPAVPDYDATSTPTNFAAAPPCFHPQDYDKTPMGPLSLRRALALSRNIPAVKVLYLAGMQDVIKNLDRFGITTLTDPNEYGLSLVLGGGAVRPIELVEAYSVLATEGIKHKQTMILEVQDSSGNVLESYHDDATQVVDPEYPRLINNILSDASARAELYGNVLNLTTFPDRDVALKTGTSNDYRDAWATGYTPSLVASVWVGNNDNAPMQRHGSSILAAIPIWHDFLAQVFATEQEPFETFTRPDPQPESKPILAGNYLAGNQIHSILYYVEKDNPLGAPPADPTADLQFTNWETGVLGWAAANLPDFKDLNQASGTAALVPASGAPINLAAPSVSLSSPQNGSYVAPQEVLTVDAAIAGSSPIASLAVYWNGGKLQTFSGSSGMSYHLKWSFTPSSLLPQNLLEVEATDEKGLVSRASAVVYAR